MKLHREQQSRDLAMTGPLVALSDARNGPCIEIRKHPNHWRLGKQIADLTLVALARKCH
ncbi:hypothetical protein ACFODZ_07320 [Marinicella sediminis]|uniref:Uncharacterized protein n=1 Tax=Marinicella sediminis TaxID=1792834 RepID=A0ABV7JAE7_9GAMM|nr:hypothetical protein [Marinicella sediminis]